MSSTPTKHIDGDVAIGRNVSIGGNANIQGKVRIGHDVIVGGWLEAKNIKGAAKGFFKTEADLLNHYPAPQGGWWALVGEELPATIYIVQNGKWYNTNKLGGDKIDLDFHKYDDDITSLYMQLQIAQTAADDALIENVEFTSASDNAMLGITQQGGNTKQITIPKADEEHAGLMCGLQYTQLQGLYEKSQKGELYKPALIVEMAYFSTTDYATLGVRQQGGNTKQVTIPKADEEHAGLMCSHQYTQLQGLYEKSQNGELYKPALIVEMAYFSTTDYATLGVRQQGGNTQQVTIPKADEEHAGLMCSHQYTQLQGLYEKSKEWTKAATTANNALAQAQAVQNAGAVTPWFSGIVVDAVSDEELVRASFAGRSTDLGCAVVYDRTRGIFLLRTGTADSLKYYLNWEDALQMGMTQASSDSDKAACYIPKPGVLYRATLPPFGLYYFDYEGTPHLLDGTQVGNQMNIEVLSQEAYNALSDDEVRADTLYFVTEDAEGAG